MAQKIIVALLVMACFSYALWTLGPKAQRGRLATALLKLPLPLVLQRPLKQATRQQGGCGGCGGCAGNGMSRKSPPKSAAYAAQATKENSGDFASAPLVFYPRPVPVRDGDLSDLMRQPLVLSTLAHDNSTARGA
jgi:hypothetical protein